VVSCTTTLVENFPGLPDGDRRAQLIANMHEQAEIWRAFPMREVTDFESTNNHLRVKADDYWLETRAFIIASGASAVPRRKRGD
jgi:thioredoxin reductase (NADPH)